jgi:TolB protein
MALVLVGCGTPDPAVEGNERLVAGDGPAGRILFVSDHNVMVWRDGSIDQVTRDVYAAMPSWASAGDRFAYIQVHDGFSEIVVASANGDPLLQVTSNDPGLEPYTEEFVFNAAWAWDPDWSPAGEQLIYVSDKGGLDIYSRPLYLWFVEDWEVDPYALNASFEIGVSQESPAFSPDGSQAAFVVRNEHGDDVRLAEVWTLDLDLGIWEVIAAPPDGAFDPDWSPDGDNIVYTARTGQSTDIWVAPAEGGEPYQLTTLGACSEPVWSPDGEYIAFMYQNGASFEVWYAGVTLDANGRYVATEPAELFSADNIDAPSGLSWIGN